MSYVYVTPPPSAWVCGVVSDYARNVVVRARDGAVERLGHAEPRLVEFDARQRMHGAAIQDEYAVFRRMNEDDAHGVEHGAGARGLLGGCGL